MDDLTIDQKRNQANLLAEILLSNYKDYQPESHKSFGVEDLRPQLEENLMKRNIGMSPESYIICKIAEHNIACISEIVSAKHRVNDFYNYLIESHKYNLKLINIFKKKFWVSLFYFIKKYFIFLEYKFLNFTNKIK